MVTAKIDVVQKTSPRQCPDLASWTFRYADRRANRFSEISVSRLVTFGGSKRLKAKSQKPKANNLVRLIHHWRQNSAAAFRRKVGGALALPALFEMSDRTNNRCASAEKCAGDNEIPPDTRRVRCAGG